MTFHSLWYRSVRTLSIYSHLPSDVHALAAARFVSGLGRFVYPFLALLLTKRMGLSTTEAGTLIFFAAMAVIPGALIGGKLADIFGRKRILVIMQAATALLILPGAFLIHHVVIAYLIIIANFFNGAARPAASALVTDRTAPENRQAAFSLLYLGFNAGYAVGPLFAGFLFEKHAPLLFVGDAVSTFIAVVLSIIFVRESTPGPDEMARAAEINPEESPELGGLVRVLLRRPFLLMFLVAALILNFVYAQSGFTLPLQLGQLFASRGPVYFGIIMTINAVSVVLLTAPIISLTRRFRPVRNLLAVAVLYAIGFGMLFFAHQVWLFVLSVLIWSVGEVINATNMTVYLANHTPASHRGRMNGFAPIVWGTGRAVNAPIVGALMEHHPIGIAWVMAFVLACMGGGLLFVLGNVENRRHGRAAGQVSSST